MRTADFLSARSAEADLLDRLEQLDGLVVAFSGGVDSAVVLAGAVRALGAEAQLAAIADSPSLARAELSAARLVAVRQSRQDRQLRPLHRFFGRPHPRNLARAHHQHREVRAVRSDLDRLVLSAARRK